MSCPAGKVSFSGGAAVYGSGSADFHTLIRESSPGSSPSSSQWVVALANNDSVGHTIGFYAVCASPPPGYLIVRKDHYLVAGEFLRVPTPCLPATVSVGGGMQVVNVEPADFGTKLQESSPGTVPASTSWTLAMRNGPAGYDIATYAVCVGKPDGYEVVRTKVTVG